MLRIVATPHRCARHATGVDTAASLVVAAGDNPEWLRSEAAWAVPLGSRRGRSGTPRRVAKVQCRRWDSSLYFTVVALALLDQAGAVDFSLLRRRRGDPTPGVRL